MKKLLLSLSFLPVLVFAQAVLPTSWSFINPTPTGASSSTPTTGPATTYDTKVGWSTKLDNTVTGSTPFTYATGADGNAACRLDAQDEYVMIAFAEKPGYLSYQIKGTAISAPYFSGSFKVQESVDGTSWTDKKEFTAMTNTFAKDSVALSSTSRYARFYYTTKVSGSNVALDNIVLSTPPTPPFGIAVKQGATALANGTTVVNGNSATSVLTLQNIGNLQSLIIDSVKITGTNAPDYSFGTNKDTILANASKNINLLFTPSANGSRFATLSIYSNDADRNPFVINLYGIGGSVASEPTQAASLALQNVKTYAMDVKYGKSTNAEGYLVLRKTGSSLTEKPVDGISYKRGDTIGGAQVAYIGADTFAVKPTYILANTTYTFAAFAYSGPTGFENYNTTAAPSASATTPNGAAGTYYASIDANQATFIADLHARIKTPHDTIFYSNYTATLINNFLTRDTLGGKRVVNCVYSGEAYVYNEPFLWWGNTGNGTLTREHTFAQSWMPSNTGGAWPEVNGKEVLEYNDQHHLFPTNQLTANVKRSNNPFGMVITPTYTSPTGQGKLGADVGGKTVYEPTNDQKGDLARALFYMLVRYDGDRGNVWRLPVSQDIPTLLLWHQQDPPSPEEIARHEYIASVQHNRNPFIDHPEWVNRINFSNMTYIANPTGKSIVVTAPNGGESFIAGTTQNITWTSQNIDLVVIEVKLNDSSAWGLLTNAELASKGTYPWTIPFSATSTAKVRVSDRSNSALADSSNNPFTIQVPSLTITSPIGGEVWFGDDGIPDTITWESNNIDSIEIDLLVNDTLLKHLGKSVALSKMFMVPDSLIIQGAIAPVKIRLVFISSPSIVSVSPNPFFIMLSDGLEDLLEKTALTIFPNPSTGTVNIDLTENLSGTLIVSDITGRVLSQTPLLQKNVINISDRGVYFVKLQTENGSVVKKLIIE